MKFGTFSLSARADDIKADETRTVAAMMPAQTGVVGNLPPAISGIGVSSVRGHSVTYFLKLF
jgi:hypothetical protein